MKPNFSYPIVADELGDLIDCDGLVISWGTDKHYNSIQTSAYIADCLNALKNVDNPKEWIKEAVSIKGTMVELCGLLGVETQQQAYDKVKRLMHPETCEVIVEKCVCKPDDTTG